MGKRHRFRDHIDPEVRRWGQKYHRFLGGWRNIQPSSQLTVEFFQSDSLVSSVTIIQRRLDGSDVTRSLPNRSAARAISPGLSRGQMDAAVAELLAQALVKGTQSVESVPWQASGG